MNCFPATAIAFLHLLVLSPTNRYAVSWMQPQANRLGAQVLVGDNTNKGDKVGKIG